MTFGFGVNNNNQANPIKKTGGKFGFGVAPKPVEPVKITEPIKTEEIKSSTGLQKFNQAIAPVAKASGKFLEGLGTVFSVPFKVIESGEKLMGVRVAPVELITKKGREKFKQQYEAAPTIGGVIKQGFQAGADLKNRIDFNKPSLKATVGEGLSPEQTKKAYEVIRKPSGLPKQDVSGYQFTSELTGNFADLTFGAAVLGLAGGELVNKTKTLKITPEDLAGNKPIVLNKVEAQIIGVIGRKASPEVIQQIKEKGLKITIKSPRGGVTQFVGEQLGGRPETGKVEVKIPNFKRTKTLSISAPGAETTSKNFGFGVVPKEQVATKGLPTKIPKQKITPKINKVSNNQPIPYKTNILYHGSDNGKLKVDDMGNINLTNNKELTNNFGSTEYIPTANLNIKEVSSKEELFNAVNPKLPERQKLIDSGVDVVSFDNHQIAINPKKINKVSKLPLKKNIKVKSIKKLNKTPFQVKDSTKALTKLKASLPTSKNPPLQFQVSEGTTNKPEFTRGNLKVLFQNSPEFKANPNLTVTEKNGNKMLSFNGKNNKFSINAKALGLNSETINVGDVINIDPKQLRVKGEEFKIVSQFPTSKKVDDIVSQNAIEATAKMAEKGQAGFARFPFVKETPTAPDRNAAVKSVLQEGKKTPGIKAELKSIFQKIISSIDDYRWEPQLIRAGFKQLADDIRTGPTAFSRQAREFSEIATNAPVADLKKKDQELVFDLLFLKDFAETARQGKVLPGGLTIKEVEADLGKLDKQLSDDLKSRAVKIRETLDAIKSDLVERGKLEANEGTFDYMPHYVVDYLPDWWNPGGVYIPKRIKPSYRSYLKERKGSSRLIKTSKDAVQAYIATVRFDNAMDDWAMSKATEYDLMPDLKSSKSPKELTGLFGQPQMAFGKTPVRKALPNRLYEIDGKPYRGFQYIPGRVMFNTGMADPTAIEDAVDRGLSVEEFQDENGLREGVALGAYRKVYVLPEEVYNRFMHFKDPTGNNPLTYNLMLATRTWKRMTLDLAGLPYQFGNIFGDFLNFAKTSVQASREIPYTVKIIGSFLSPKQATKLTEFDQEFVQFLKDKDVVESGFINSYMLNPKMGKSPLSWIEEASNRREQLLRVAMASYQYKRVLAGLPLKPKDIDISGIDQMSGAAKIAREFSVDYSKSPIKFRKYISGLAAPFARFFLDNAKNWGRYARYNPIDLMVKFGLLYVALWAYNNTGDRKEIEENLPNYYRQQTHLILKGIDINNDGINERAIVWSMNTPIDLAASWIAGNKIGDKITMVRAGRMTPLEATKAQFVDMGLAVPENVNSLLNPMFQFFQGIATNKDPYSGRAIVPDKLANTPEAKKLIAEYLLEKMALPLAQYNSSVRKGDYQENPFLTVLLKGPLDFKRAIGIREVNLVGNEYKSQQDELNRAEGKRNQALYNIENYFVKGQNTALSEAIQQGISSGVISASDVANRLSNKSVIIDSLTYQLTQTKDQDKRNQIQNTIYTLRRIQKGEAIKAVPKSIRDDYLIGLVEKNLLK